MELLDVFVIYNLDDHKYTNWLAIPFFKIWLVVWNMNFIFPYIGNNHPN